MTKLDKLRYGGTDKPWLNGDRRAYTVLSMARLFIRIKASSLIILSSIYEQKLTEYVVNLSVT